MPSRPEVQDAAGAVPESMIRAQLERILACESFSRSERLSRFLRFIVEETLEGQAAGIKEQVLACQLYAKGADFNTAADPVVRVDARRLRDKLREYYSDFPHDPLIISLPKGGYAPVFERNPGALSPTPVRRAPSLELQEVRRWSRRAWMAGVIATVGAIIATAWLMKPARQDLPPRMVPLTSYPGNEGQASLSPDGNFVAYACTAPDATAQADICVKAVGTEVVQRLTETPTAEYWPAWSPDSSQILFGRGPSGSAPAFQEFGQELGIFIVSRMGGPERKMSDTGAIAKWVPDGRSLLIRDRLKNDEPYAIFQVDLNNAQRRRLTQPVHGAGDWLFDVSPDGRSVAFIRIGRPGISDIYVAPMHGGEPRRVTDWNRGISGLAWTPDGQELIYSLEGRLWRISSGLAQPGRGSPIPNIPMQAAGVSISQPAAGRPARLVFGSPQNPINLRRIDLRSAGSDGVFRQVLPFAQATRFNSPGRFSPDGSKVVFVSDRSSADTELWIANSDGSGPRQLTSFGSARGMLAGSWSPDGKQILFDTAIDGNHDVYVISADGGDAVRLTTNPLLDLLADWSKDGRWIYFSAETSGAAPGSNILRISARGGSPEQVTTEGGFDPQISGDGQYLYYFDRAPLAGKGRVLRIPISGAQPKVILEEVTPFLWCVADEGIYFMRAGAPAYSIYLYRFEDDTITRVGILRLRIAGLLAPGRLTVSRDGRWALVNVTDRSEGDLMLLDNFR